MKQVDLEFCEQCIYGKQKRAIFLRLGKEKKCEKLEHVHIVVCGANQVLSLGVSNYYVTFIDDATRKTWVYCIQKKFNVFDNYCPYNGKLWLRMRHEIS